MALLLYVEGVSQQINTYVLRLRRPIFTSDLLGSDFRLVILCPSLHNAPGNAFGFHGGGNGCRWRLPLVTE